MEKGRQELIAAATPCKGPATCTGKMKLPHDEVAVCTPTPDPSTYEPGEVVVIHELGIDVLAKINEKKGPQAYEVRFYDGAVLERPAAAVRGRACK